MPEISEDRLMPIQNADNSSVIEVSNNRLSDPGVTADDSWKITARNVYLNLKPYVKPTAEIGAFTLGGISGAAGGTVLGGPIGGVAGGMAGAGLAYGGVQSLFDTAENMLGLRKPKGVVGETIEAGKNILTGAVYQSGGEMLGKAWSQVSPVVKRAIIGGVTGAGTGAYIDETNRGRGALVGGAIGVAVGPAVLKPFTRRGAAEMALKEFEGNAKGTELTQPQIDANMKIAKELEKRISETTGKPFKFSEGQLTNDASAIALERKLARSGGQDLSQEQREYSINVLNDYYNRKMLQIGNIEDFTKYVDTLNKEIEAGTKQAENAVLTQVMRLSRHMDEQAMGKSIHNVLAKGKEAMKTRATELYDKIPDLNLKTESLSKNIDKFVMEENALIEPRTKKAISLVKKYITKTKKDGDEVVEEAVDLSYQTMRKLHSRIGKMYGDANSGIKPDLEDARQLHSVMNMLDDAMKQVEDLSPAASKAYKKATNFYKTTYLPTYRQGTVADILQRGPRKEDTRIAMANIAKEFNSLDGIDDFIRAVGNNTEARKAMSDYYSFDFINHAVKEDKVVHGSANRWLAHNFGKLKKLGLYDEFKNIAGMQKKVDELISKKDIFNKSVAGKILESDLESMVENAFRGSKNYARTASELMGKLKGDKAAEQGLQKAFAEFFMRKPETTKTNFFQSGGETISEMDFNKSVAKVTTLFKQYLPAIRVIYKNEPKKQKVLMDIWRAYETLGRTSKSTLAGGSDTFELFAGQVDRALSATVGGVAPGKFYLFKGIREMVRKFGRGNVDAFLTKAMFDPEYALVLKDIAKSGPKPENIKTLNRLMTLTIYETNKLTDQKREKP